ncbi:hypothetical protein TrCOL_g9442 [Triparma columacea]|uniref:Sugar phosphate transporter domain-containing protein n=1 Tax=Triparma columacea TaxID=722753 RepID=A0A9W7FXE6_9STRA|nr:hypothetical protein TrCOL_g9442 [Triparma columacea]
MDKNQKHIAIVVASYWFVSISMVFLNKTLMSSSVSIDAPIFVTWFQCLATVGICKGCSVIGQNQTTKQNQANKDGTGGGKGHHFFNQFPILEYDPTVALKILPLSIIFVGMITFNNLCLKWVEVSFYNVARSLTIVFNVVLSFLILSSPSSSKTLMTLGVVVMGFFVGTSGEVNFSVRGTTAGIMSSVFVSLNSIFTKKLLSHVQDNHWRLTFYNNVNALILFLPLILIFESSRISTGLPSKGMIFWSAMSLAGAMGFLIGIVTVLQIKATSPLTHNISGTAKAAVQSAMAFHIWGNEATGRGVAGIAMVLGGSLAYMFVKTKEAKQQILAK